MNALTNHVQIPQGLLEPLREHPRPLRCLALVQQPIDTHALRMTRSSQLREQAQRPKGRVVEPEELRQIVCPERVLPKIIRVVEKAEVVDYRGCRAHGELLVQLWQRVDRDLCRSQETLEILLDVFPREFTSFARRDDAVASVNDHTQLG